MAFIPLRQYAPRQIQAAKQTEQYVDLSKLPRDLRALFWRYCQQKRPELAKTIEQTHAMQKLVPGSSIQITQQDYDDVMGR